MFESKYLNNQAIHGKVVWAFTDNYIKFYCQCPLTTIQKDKVEKITSSCCYITFILLLIIMHFYEFQSTPIPDSPNGK